LQQGVSRKIQEQAEPAMPPLSINETEQEPEDLFSYLTALNLISGPLHASLILLRLLMCGIDSATSACRAPTGNLTRPPSPWP
jgi:hypothetical protein